MYQDQDAAVADPSAIEEELRRLGYNMSAGTSSVLPPRPNPNPGENPQSAIAAIIAARQAAGPFVSEKPVPDVVAPPPPPPPPAPVEEQANSTAADDSGGLPWWMVPLLIGGGALLRGRGKNVAKALKGAKGAEGVESAVAAATVANAARAKAGAKAGTVMHGPPTPPAAAVTALPAPPAQRLLTHQPLPVPPPSLTQTDTTPAISQALLDRASKNVRGPVSDRMPTPPTPRPVLPTYTAPLDAAKDIQGNELAKAIRVGGSVARERAKSAAKTERLNKKRPPAPQRYTPDYRVPQEEGERKSFNEVVQAIRDAKNPPKIVKDLKPWLKEIKKDIGQPVLPKKKPGPAPKPKYKEVPEVAKALGKRKVNTARKGKTTPKTLSERGKGKK